MLTQTHGSIGNRLNRAHHKSYDMSTNIHWTFTQGPLLLLKITQKTNYVTVSLLRFSVEGKKQTVVSVWNLPFKLSVLRPFLMRKEIDSSDHKSLMIIHRSNRVPMYQKFSELMYNRITEVALACSDANEELQCVTTKVKEASSFDPSLTLGNPNFRDSNSFMQSIYFVSSKVSFT